jgi:hypothetical protein
MSTLIAAELSVGAAIALADINRATSSVLWLAIIACPFKFNANPRTSG